MTLGRMETLDEAVASVYTSDDEDFFPLDDDDEDNEDNDDDKYYNPNSTRKHKKQKEDVQRQQVKQLTLKETRNMRIWKTLVFAFLVMAAAVVSAGTYFFVKKTETEEFEHTVRT